MSLMELIDAYANHRMVDGAHDLVDDHPDTLKSRAAVVAEVEKLEALLSDALYALEYASDMTKPEGLSGCDCPICTVIGKIEKHKETTNGQDH